MFLARRDQCKPTTMFVDVSLNLFFCCRLSHQVDDLAPNPDDPEDFPALSAGR